MHQNNLPKVLIIGQTFTNITGGGITLSGLFKDWPKERLAVAVGSKESFDFSKCSNYYRIGYKELKMPFPFFFFQRKTRSGAVSENFSVGEATVKKNSVLKNKAQILFNNILEYTGLNFWIYGNEKVSDSLLKWAKNFEPDVIYYQPYSYKSISFVLKLKSCLNIPLVSHMMDDWFSFSIKPSPLSLYWKSKLNQEVKKLFSNTQLHLSICDYMAEEYFNRYNYKFYPFHHSIDISFWEKYSDKVSPPSDPFTILYAGRIGYGVDKTLIRVSDAIERKGKGKNIVLEIQTKDIGHPILNKLRHYNSIKISGPIEYNLLPEKFSSVNALLIPYDFNGSGIKYIKYSMPTKVSEYMATGTPIIVVGPSETGLLQYAKTGWAQVCEDDSEEKILQSILELKESKALQKKITKVAKELAIKNHDTAFIVKQFREHLIRLSKRRKEGKVEKALITSQLRSN